VKYDIKRKDRRNRVNKIIDDKRSSRLGAKDGDIRITRDELGVKLNVKYGTKWYSSILRGDAELVETNFKESGIEYKNHYLYDGTHAKDTWLLTDFGLDRTRSLPATHSHSTLWFVPEDMNLVGIKMILNVTGANGDYGFRLARYKGAGSDLMLPGSFKTTHTVLKDIDPVRGNDYFLPLYASLKRGEVYTMECYGPTTTCFTYCMTSWILQNKTNINK
jgi:hypothetical protein